MKKLTAILLIFTFILSGCAASGTVDLMEEVPARVICLAEFPDRSAEATDFGIRLFQSSMQEGENTLISPLSVLSALAMTANGADGETLAQMEATLGMTREDMNSYLYSYMDGQGDELKLANSIWFTNEETFSVNQQFLETNADFYQADIFQTPMDETTLEEINGWVNEKTDGMIPKILNEVPESVIMYLVNALAFDADWEKPYPGEARGDIFTTEDGRSQTADFMYFTEQSYLEDDAATGFIKYYEDRQYAFVALLPKEGVSVSDYAASLTGAHLQNLLASPESITVHAAIPTFETDYDVEMADILKKMGMVDAFDASLADFSKLGTSENGNISISRVMHKTKIIVDEQGTKAAAVTVVAPTEAAAAIEDYRTVTLDRPFVYILIDCQQNLPLFIGTMMNMEG